MTRSQKHKDHHDNDLTLPWMMRWRLAGVRIVAGVFLLTERALENFWPLILWVSFFASLWLLQIPTMFGTGFEIAVALCFALGSMAFLGRAFMNFYIPRRHDITRRIEQDSDLPHRPLSGLDDRLANPSRQSTLLLWSQWQSRLLPALQKLRWPTPHPVLTRIDPYALRGLAAIILIASCVMAGPSWPERLKHGMVPVLPSFVTTPSEKIVLWITPPDYTGQKQIVLKGSGGKNVVSIPEGSVIKARVNGWPGTPSLVFDKTVLPMEKMGGNSHGIETPVQNAEKITIRQMMLPRATWEIAYGTDLPPTISLKEYPSIDSTTGDIKIPLVVSDDYSVESMTTTIRLAPSVITPPPFGNNIVDTRSVMSAANTPMDFTPKLNVAWHPWAGMDAIVDIEIRDHKGQIATLKDIPLTLPERQFRHPTAKKLVELRKRLIWTPEAAAQNVGHGLQTIMETPAAYSGDARVFLSLRTAAARIYHDQTPNVVANIIAQIWDTALRIEDGDFSMAQRNLQSAQRNLQDALKDPTSTQEEIAGLMEELRMAMAQYMQEAFREMQKRMAEQGKEMQLLSPEMFMNNIDPQELAAFMDRMQAEAMSGDRNAAREMLSQMERLMEMMDPASMQTELPKDMQDMMEGMEKLQEIIDAQKALMAETQALGQYPELPEQSYSETLPLDIDALNKLGMEDMPPQPQETLKAEPPPEPSEKTDSTAQKTAQEDIRKSLGEFMLDIEEKLGQEAPQNMGKADQAMKSAIDTLALGQPGNAVLHQDEAIKHLSESQQDMSKKLGERMKQMMMMSFGAGATDPLGRPMKEGEDGMPGSASKVKIPEEAERKKIHGILENLRKKSGELQRPAYELDYYRRLMRQF
jgi:uncharacterized protein (TIGR02302 family)